jgi:hypothetical protein
MPVMAGSREACRTMPPPTKPVAPVTMIFIARYQSCRAGV